MSAQGGAQGVIATEPCDAIRKGFSTPPLIESSGMSGRTDLELEADL